MQQKTKEAIEAFLKKSGFWKISKKEIYAEGKTPHMKICDLTGEAPWVGLSTGTQRQEAEECGSAQVQDIKTFVLNIFHNEESIKKPSEESGSHNPVPSQEVSHPPPILNGTPAPSDGESHGSIELPYICSACKTGISAEQRTATVESCKRALCAPCSQIPLVPNAPAKEEPKPPEPEKEAKKKHKGNKDAKTKEKTENPPPVQQAAEPIQPVMCKDCGVELSHIRALEYLICEDCAEKRRIAAEQTIPLKSREKENTMNEKPESKEIIPAAKPIRDHERDQQIEKAKAKRFLEGQGGSYKVNGNEIPDSARIQNIANDAGISVQILESEQNDDYARVRVRGNLGKQSVDDEVWVDFDTELKLLMMEFIRKNDGVLDYFDGLNPVFKEGAKIKNFDGSYTDAKYALVHAMLTLRKFAVRSAGTKAAKRVQMKLMNKEFREIEEIADEQAETDLVDSNKRRK